MRERQNAFQRMKRLSVCVADENVEALETHEKVKKTLFEVNNV